MAHLERAGILLDSKHECAPRLEAHDRSAPTRARRHDHLVRVRVRVRERVREGVRVRARVRVGLV